MELLIFYPLAGLCVVLAMCVVLNKSPIGSAISLIGMMLGLAGIFVLQQAHFIAVLQIIIYAGAIMVLFMFVIMLLNLQRDDAAWRAREKNTLLTVLTGLLVAGVLYKLIEIINTGEFNSPAGVPDTFGTTREVGTVLFTEFVLPFEVASILLLVAMIGAVVLAKSKVD
ncbi:NADH-quinone oxidoreductase, subunit J [Candidatus Nitromaritima sp. SCGC AAA799-C22]|nr:NADH-quinone oxidoreductase, subunit J [Candidatus Nitromaritima sp. SCGC AAA799-C22]